MLVGLGFFLVALLVTGVVLWTWDVTRAMRL